MTSTGASAILGRSQATNPNDPPQSGTNPTTFGDSETAIWTYTMTTAAVTPQWIDPDGSRPSTATLYDPTSNAFFLTSSPSTITSQHPSAHIVVCVILHSFYWYAESAPRQTFQVERLNV